MSTKAEQKKYDIEGWGIEIEGNKIRAVNYHDKDKYLSPELKDIYRRHMWSPDFINMGYSSHGKLITGTFYSQTLCAFMEPLGKDEDDFNFEISPSKRSNIGALKSYSTDDAMEFLDSFSRNYFRGYKLRYENNNLRCVNVDLLSEISSHDICFNSTFVDTYYRYPDYSPEQKGWGTGVKLIKKIPWSEYSKTPKNLKIQTELEGPASETLEIHCRPESKTNSIFLDLNRNISINSKDPKMRKGYGTNSSATAKLPSILGEFMNKPNPNDIQQVFSRVKSFDDFFRNMAISMKQSV
jgi:hypothetical protein